MSITGTDYRITVTTATAFSKEIARDILATEGTDPAAREYAEHLLTLPGTCNEPAPAETHTAKDAFSGGSKSTSSKPANPGELISATPKQIAALINMGSKKLIGDATVRHLTADIPVQDIVDRATAGTIVTKGEASKARDHFVGGMILDTPSGGVNIRRVREVGEQMPSDDVFLVCVEGVKPGTWSDYASKLYRRSELAALFATEAR
jgi:hypothetical protein